MLDFDVLDILESRQQDAAAAAAVAEREKAAVARAGVPLFGAMGPAYSGICLAEQQDRDVFLRSETCGMPPVCANSALDLQASIDIMQKFAAEAVEAEAVRNAQDEQLSELEARLWRDTDGLFEPRDSAYQKATPPRLPSTPSAKDGAKVSVICPTTFSRRCFHQFLVMCFKIQTYSPRELIIIETCEEEPSEYVQKMCREDERIVYKHYRVPETDWSIGLKRNLACYHATGSIIAHFDDDDMYGANYLDDMVNYLAEPIKAFQMAFVHLQQHELYNKMTSSMGLYGNVGDGKLLEQALKAPQAGKARPYLGDFGAAIAKLSCWHEYALRSRSWSTFNAAEYSGNNSQIYGWGFSLVYLKAAWEAGPFRHMDLGEDYDFVKNLRSMEFPLILVHDTRGMCAHTCHADNITGGDPEEGRNFASTAQMYSPVASLVSLYENAARGILAKQAEQLERQRALKTKRK